MRIYFLFLEPFHLEASIKTDPVLVTLSTMWPRVRVWLEVYEIYEYEGFGFTTDGEWIYMFLNSVLPNVE